MNQFLALFILVVIPSVCKGLLKTCNVLPKDPYIEVGSDIEVLCQTSCVQGKTFWDLESRPLSENQQSVIINSSHTVLSLRNFTYPSATLLCHSADTRLVLGGTTIKTYSKPRKISCFLHYDNQETLGVPEMFTCNWEHQTDSSLAINYTVLCASSSNPLQNEICNSHETTCTSKYEDIEHVIPLGRHYNVTVRAKSAAWEASSDHYEFTPRKILKIVHPKLNVAAVSDHLLVGWLIPAYVPKYLYHCEVKYRKDANKGTTEWVLSENTTSKKKGEMTIAKVESCSNYTCAVRCALNEAPWSDWSPEKTVLTKLKKRDFKPRLWRNVAEVVKNGRKVRAMWLEIPSTCRDTFTYTVRQIPYQDNMTGVSGAETLCGNSVCDVSQDAHRITLNVFQNEVLFAEDSVYVPASGECSPQVTDIQSSTSEGVILLSWKAPAQPVSGYMIDYTHDGNQYYWKETKYTNATLFDLLDKKPYNITVTPLFDDKTGHGTQAIQICSRLGDPGNVSIISVQAKDKSARVSWKVASQEPCTGAVVNHTVFYSTQGRPQLVETVAGATWEIVLEDLNPETQYSVYVKAAALTGMSKSSERFFKTKRFDPRLSTALSVCGGILICLVLSLGLCCAIQWKKFKDKPVPNPGHSSVASWPSTSHKPFHNPPKSICDRVYTEEDQTTSPSTVDAGCNDNPASDHTEEYANPVFAPDAQSEVETTELLPSENIISSPYQSQSPVETPAQRSSKQCKHVPVKQQEKVPPLTVYVSLDMFGQGR